MSQFLSLLKKNFFIFIVFLLTVPVKGFSVQEGHAADEKEFNASELILHHVMDDHVWHLWDHGGTIYLPVIVYSAEKGLDIFSSRHFYDEHHNLVEYNGYKLEHNHIYLAESHKAVLDFQSPKMWLCSLLIAALLLLVFVGRGKRLRKK